MKPLRLDNNINLIGIKNFKKQDKLIDYYLVLPNHTKLYAFRRNYTHNTYNMCKSGILVNELLGMRSRDTSIMHLVKYTNVMMPYLVEEYGLRTA